MVLLIPKLFAKPGFICFAPFHDRGWFGGEKCSVLSNPPSPGWEERSHPTRSCCWDQVCPVPECQQGSPGHGRNCWPFPIPLGPLLVQALE